MKPGSRYGADRNRIPIIIIIVANPQQEDRYVGVKRMSDYTYVVLDRMTEYTFVGTL